ncbi:polyketide cyclase/dehydrase/lipid transport protein [Thermosporothrix hazakensis]|jgi:uncharacterized membrane protein|uniref:Polyketide cyclase/dehydrase/lipid transport protein n=2 Tax=Thermosporothrix TaxID=768650 RepID=A0A326UCB4_THEHA|nr:SRPBCC family protein [Thermosporothrix hazakensis]PZW33005.1 polyketide cyclase/dehydrase/lipid transport protein [Thermosporothrix hazakensis]BBH90987.1 hypothetical protein KTC_57380 [Thermosporothrix sp. COM3]GCE49037.1 hypothetical protein KTH_39060 [Thermosporothrix hazakensis]
MATPFTQHHVSVVVNAPVHEVYSLFAHFREYPGFLKVMSFIKEVTYYDDQRSHWVAELFGRHEWDAIRENWVEGQQIGWRSTKGLENFGKITFKPTSMRQTLIEITIHYKPPAGALGDLGEKLGAGSRLEHVLHKDLTDFARMVDQAPPGALDPASPHFLFPNKSTGQTSYRRDEHEGSSNRIAEHLHQQQEKAVWPYQREDTSF